MNERVRYELWPEDTWWYLSKSLYCLVSCMRSFFTYKATSQFSGLSGRVKVVELPSTADTVGTAEMSSRLIHCEWQFAVTQTFMDVQMPTGLKRRTIWYWKVASISTMSPAHQQRARLQTKRFK